jgi:rod shape-determining protein MreD
MLLGEHALHVLGLFIVASCTTLLLSVLLGADFPGFTFFVSPALTALAWAPVSWVLYSSAVRRRREDAR